MSIIVGYRGAKFGTPPKNFTVREAVEGTLKHTSGDGQLEGIWEMQEKLAKAIAIIAENCPEAIWSQLVDYPFEIREG